MASSDHSATRDPYGHRRARSAGESVFLVGIGVALLGLATWSAARARTGDASADLPSAPRGGGAALNDALLVASGALAAAVVILVAPAFIRHGRRPARATDDDEPRRPNVWLRVFCGLMVIFVVVFVILLAANNRPDQTQPLPPVAPPAEEIPPRSGTRAGAHGWSAAALAAAGAIAVVTGVVVWRRRGRARWPVPHGDDTRPIAAPVEPIDFDALAPGDAVRSAYAAARTSLAPLGVESLPPETPYQYLDRVRAVAPDVAQPVATLTRLFEVARFSHHPVTPAMKAEAIAAYQAIAGAVARSRDEAVLT